MRTCSVCAVALEPRPGERLADFRKRRTCGGHHYNTRVEAGPKVCEHCRGMYERKPGESSNNYERRRFCSSKCAARGARAVQAATEEARRLERMEDVEWIIRCDHPERVAQRTGFASVESLERWLYRYGRPDLVHALHAAEVAA